MPRNRRRLPKYRAYIERLKESRTKLVQSIRDANDSLRLECDPPE